jgi:hypothetical protein
MNARTAHDIVLERPRRRLTIDGHDFPWHILRRAVGVEIDERWCEIAARRLAQGVLDLGDVS